jgi:hypothetical protein
MKSSIEQQFTSIDDEIKETRYLVSDLEDGETYYWYVVPYDGEIKGYCVSGTWNFKVKKDIQIIYGLTLITDVNQISILPGHSKAVTITVTNIGNSIDQVDLYVDSLGLPDEFVNLEYQDTGITLNPNASIDIGLVITIEKDEEVGEYMITIKGTSRQGGSTITDSQTIKVKVPGTEGGELEQFNWIIPSILIIIIIILLSILFISKRKKMPTVEGEHLPPSEPQLAPPETFVAVPGAISPSTPSLEKPPVSSTPEQLPPRTAVQEQQQATTKEAPAVQTKTEPTSPAEASEIKAESEGVTTTSQPRLPPTKPDETK